MVLQWNLVEKIRLQAKGEFKDWVSTSLNALITHNNPVNCNCCNGPYK